MKKLLYAIAIVVLVAPIYGPVFGQDESIDVTNILGGLGGGGNNRGGFNRGGRGNNFSIPDSTMMFQEIQQTLKKGKTPMEKAQEKPIKTLIDTEMVTISDKIQLLRNNNNNNNNNFPGNFPGNNGNTDNAGNTGGTRGGRGGRGEANQPNQPNNQPAQPSAQAIQIDTITSLKNEDFLATKLSLFLSPEQAALVQKAHADDKANANCLGGLLDHYYQQLQNPNRGNNNNFNPGNNNNNNNNNNNRNNNNSNATRPNGQKYCMTTEATPSERLEPIRKVLEKGKLPLAKDKDMIAEVFMKAELQDLEASFRSGLTSNNQGRGNNNNNNNRNNDPRQMIQSSVDNIYKKVEAALNPAQAETLKTWHYTQMLDRGGIETLIAVNAMQDTPLSDDQIAKVTAAWPELRTQISQAAKAANRSVSDKERDAAAMSKILEMLDPPQVASYQLAKKYGPQAAAGGK